MTDKKKTPTGSAGEQINKTSGCFFPAAAPLLRNGAVCIIWHLRAHASLSRQLIRPSGDAFALLETSPPPSFNLKGLCTRRTQGERGGNGREGFLSSFLSREVLLRHTAGAVSAQVRPGGAREQEKLRDSWRRLPSCRHPKHSGGFFTLSSHLHVDAPDVQSHMTSSLQATAASCDWSEGQLLTTNRVMAKCFQQNSSQ